MIDLNAYAGPWPFRALPATSPHEVASLLREAGVSRALVSPLEALFFEDPQVANERLAAGIPPDGVLLLCAVLNPTLPGWQEALAAACSGLGARALRLHPNYHAYPLECPEAQALTQAAGQEGLPVIVQLRMQDTRAQHPLCCVPDVPVEAALGLAEGAPGARIVLGGIRFPEVQAHAARVRALPNVWVDLSQVEHVDEMRRSIALVGAERLVLGTHAPLFNLRSTLLKLEEGLLSDGERAAITRENARRLLRI